MGVNELTTVKVLLCKWPLHPELILLISLAQDLGRKECLAFRGEMGVRWEGGELLKQQHLKYRRKRSRTNLASQITGGGG